MTADSPEPVLSSVSFFRWWFFLFWYERKNCAKFNAFFSRSECQFVDWIGSVVETRRRKYVCGPWQNSSQLDVVWFWYHARRINKCCFGTWKCACAWVRSRSPLQKQKSKSEHTLIIIKVITIIVKAKWLCAALIQQQRKKHAKQNDEEEMDEKEEGRQKLN